MTEADPSSATVAISTSQSAPSEKKLSSKEKKLLASKLRKKEKKKQRQANQKSKKNDHNQDHDEKKIPVSKNDDVEIEYVATTELPPGADIDPSFATIFEKFRPDFSAKEVEAVPEEKTLEVKHQDSDSEEEEKKKKKEIVNDGEKKPTKKERKELKRLKIAVLKRLVDKPEVVETHDVNSADPEFLVFLKSYRNTVPVPKHWSQKRKYLQNKRGTEKPPFQLPAFIADTGITKIRAAIAEKDDEKKTKAKQRERTQPKMGKLAIDYQVLHDAFFKYQTKPKLTGHGDVYYEGKEFEIKLKEKIPGILSADLKRALGMTDRVPPPWLINMQRYGPPPAYPNLKIPGLNAPLPPGCVYGFHVGGWGKPPLDEAGRPLYGDVFGVAVDPSDDDEKIVLQKTHWGQLEEDEASESEEEFGDEEEEHEHHNGALPNSQVLTEDQFTQGIESTAGLETPDTMDVRKVQKEKSLYQVLEQTEAKVGSAVYGSSHTYIIPGGNNTSHAPAGERVDLLKSQKTPKVNITLNPADLENQEELESIIKKRYEETIEVQKVANQGEDMSDLLAEQERKRKRKAQKDDNKKSKKFKDFKF